MKYLIITKDNKPFYTNLFDYENLYNHDVVTCIFDLTRGLHSFDGENWVKTNIDHL